MANGISTITVGGTQYDINTAKALTIKIGSETYVFDGSEAKTVEIVNGDDIAYG